MLRDIIIDVELEINGDVDFRNVTLEEESILNNATLSLIQNADLTLDNTLIINNSNSEIEGNGNEIKGNGNEIESNGEIVITDDGSGSKLKDVVLNVPLTIEGEEVEFEAVVETGEINLKNDDISVNLTDSGGDDAWKLNEDVDIPEDYTLTLSGSGTVDFESAGRFKGEGTLVIGNDVDIDDSLYEDSLDIK